MENGEASSITREKRGSSPFPKIEVNDRTRRKSGTEFEEPNKSSSERERRTRRALQCRVESANMMIEGKQRGNAALRLRHGFTVMPLGGASVVYPMRCRFEC